MIQLRRSKDRGHFNFGWLDTYHTFSFGEYYDPKFMGFSSLRVMNEDVVAAGQGFGTHPHRDMEIITYVMEGELAHKDSMGNGSVIRPGEIQYMSAGSGVTHSEFNNAKGMATHLYQIWILPNQMGLPPRYDQKKIPAEEKLGKFRLIASGEKSNTAIEIRQDAKIFASVLDVDQRLGYELPSDRNAWVQVVRGEVDLNGTLLSQGDGAAISNENKIDLKALKLSELLLFDLSK